MSDLLAKFSELYSKETLVNALNDFNWLGNSTSEARQIRKNVYHKYSSWVKGGCSLNSAQDMAQLVYGWGFNGRKVPAGVSKNLNLFCEFNKAWESSSKGEVKVRILAEILSLNGIGIASASKWVGFIDETRYAIYDSRVSLALRPLTIDGKRAFPTVARKSTKFKKYPHADYRTNVTMARDYLNYCNFLNDIAIEYGFANLADIEMALFMLGDDQQNWK
tara:strand:+ start:199 stop:858 length:660 start_codon:yes stop_codon:yes gene_type:complete